MKTIQDNFILEAENFFGSIEDESKINDLVAKFKEAQPLLMVYLLTVGEEEDLAEYEKQSLFFIGIICWYASTLAGENPALVQEELLEKIEDRNLQMMNYFGMEDDDGFVSSIENLVYSHNQGAAIEYIINSIMEDEGISEDAGGTIFLHLKVFLECLDEV